MLRPLRAGAARGVRRALPAEKELRRRSTRSRSVDWLRRLCGRRVARQALGAAARLEVRRALRRPPATYIWARTRRMSKTRDTSGREVMGWLEGGYQTLIDALERAHPRARRRDPRRRRRRPDRRHGGPRDRARRRRPPAAVRPRAVHAARRRMARRLLAPELRRARAGRPLPLPRRRSACSCATSRSVSPYYHLNITDRRVPLTTVVETTHVVDPGARRRAPRLRRRSTSTRRIPTWSGRSTRSRPTTSGTRATIFPDLRDEEILDVGRPARAGAVEPVHSSAARSACRTIFPVPGLALASTAHVYPEIVSGQAVIGVADRVVARDPRAASGRTAGGGMTAPCPAGSARTRRRAAVAVATDGVAVGALARARRGCSPPTWGTWGDLGQRHGLRHRSPARASRTASCRTSTSSTTTARSPRSLLGLLRRWSAATGIGPASRSACSIATAIVAATYALARTCVGPLGAFLAAALVVRRSPSRRTTSATSCPHTDSATLGHRSRCSSPARREPAIAAAARAALARRGRSCRRARCADEARVAVAVLAAARGSGARAHAAASPAA